MKTVSVTGLAQLSNDKLSKVGKLTCITSDTLLHHLFPYENSSSAPCVQSYQKLPKVIKTYQNLVKFTKSYQKVSKTLQRMRKYTSQNIRKDNNF